MTVRSLAFTAASLGLLLSACGGDAAPPPAAAGGSAGAGSGGSGGSGSGGAGGKMPMMCDVGQAPTGLPTISGKFIQSDDPLKVPVTTGGDPKGLWIFDKQTVFLPPVAKGQLNEKTSTSVGTAWAEFDGTKYRIGSTFHSELDIALLGGKIPQDTVTQARGSYTIAGDVFNFVGECSTTEATGAPPRFTTDGKTITFVLNAKSDQGVADIVLEGKLQP